LSKAALKFEVLAPELIVLSFQRLYTLASHFKSLVLAHWVVQIVYTIPFVIASIAVVTLLGFRRQSIKKGFELSIEAVAVLLSTRLWDVRTQCSSGASLILLWLFFLDIREAMRSFLRRFDVVEAVGAMDVDFELILAWLVCEAGLGLATSDSDGALVPVLLLPPSEVSDVL
jgi:hypothetical protein